MGKMISASQMKIFVVKNGLYTYFKYGSSDLQVATYDELQGGEFNFINGHPSNVSGLLDGMILAEPDLEIKAQLAQLKVDCTAYANQSEDTPPEPEPTSPTVKTINWLQGQVIIIDLIDDLPRQMVATAWLVEDGFAPEYTKSGVVVHNANKYRIRVKNVKSGTIQVRLPDAANFDLSVE